jgi:hypothetical protein
MRLRRSPERSDQPLRRRDLSTVGDDEPCTAPDPSCRHTGGVAAIDPIAIDRIDFSEVTLPPGSCWGGPLPIELVEGSGSVVDPAGESTREVSGVEVLGFADSDGSGSLDVVLSMMCGAGGTAFDLTVVPLTIDELGNLGVIGGSDLGPGSTRSGRNAEISAARLNGSDIVIDEVVQIADEPTCCYTGRAVTVYRWDGVEFIPTTSDQGGSPTTDDRFSEADAVETVRAYLLAAGARDYERAWAMLDSGYQAQNRSFERFVRFWNTVDIVGFNIDPVARRVAPGRFEMSTELWFDVFTGEDAAEYVEIEIAAVDGRLLITAYRSFGPV